MLPRYALILGWILTTLAVTGNGLVICLITMRRNLRTTTNWFVLSLAVADFGFGAFYFPRYSSCWITYQSCINPAVIIAFSIGYFFANASVTSLCALTLDRYLAIVKPLRYATFMTKKRVAFLIFAAWSVAFLVLVFSLSSYLTKPETPYESIKQTFWLCVASLHIAACAFLLVTTARIFLVVRGIARQNAAVVAQLNFNHRIQHRVAFKRRETASARMIGIVVTIFIICYSLNTTHLIMKPAGLMPEKKFEILDTTLIPLLKLINSAVNPVAYAFFKREIRRELKRLLCRKRRGLGKKRKTNEVELAKKGGPWSAFRKWFPGNAGFGKLKIVNATHLYWEQIKAWDGEVIDSIWIRQQHHGPFKPL